MRIKFTCLLFVIVYRSISQCDCPASFDWMVKTFEYNDAGFQYVVDKKGKEDYAKHTSFYTEKAKEAKTYEKCHEVLNDWLKYFRSGHIGVGLKNVGIENGNKNQVQSSDAEVREKYKTSKQVNLTEKELITLLDNKKTKDPIEGVWHNRSYKIGIVADETSPKKYNGFIIKADSVYWMPKQVKVELELKDDKTYSGSYYMRDHSRENVKAELTGTSSGLLMLFNEYWVKDYPKVVMSKPEEMQVRLSSRLPYIEKLSKKTLYLRIPSFAGEEKRHIDSVLAANDKLIRSTSNLIIDIRWGTGGSDASYQNIMPYLYTNPIRGVGVELLSTELNAKAYEGYAVGSGGDSLRLMKLAAEMRKNIGKFILQGQVIWVDSSMNVLPYPQKVAIMCNRNNGSTDEQFLLEAKQSRKVKVFGAPTQGSLDISNMNFIEFPDKHFELGYCMSKSFRIPDFCIDGVGIQPDFFIDRAIKTFDWINYTQSVLEH